MLPFYSFITEWMTLLKGNMPILFLKARNLNPGPHVDSKPWVTPTRPPNHYRRLYAVLLNTIWSKMGRSNYFHYSHITISYSCIPHLSDTTVPKSSTKGWLQYAPFFYCFCMLLSSSLNLLHKQQHLFSCFTGAHLVASQHTLIILPFATLSMSLNHLRIGWIFLTLFFISVAPIIDLS